MQLPRFHCVVSLTLRLAGGYILAHTHAKEERRRLRGEKLTRRRVATECATCVCPRDFPLARARARLLYLSRSVSRGPRVVVVVVAVSPLCSPLSLSRSFVHLYGLLFLDPSSYIARETLSLIRSASAVLSFDCARLL